MVAVDGEGVARSHRGMGLVSDIFNERVLSDLPGDVAIGHTRYSTAGTSVLANAQPMLARYREGPLALAHNGNLTNAVQLRDRKSTRLNSSHSQISYAVFCLKKKCKNTRRKFNRRHRSVPQRSYFQIHASVHSKLRRFHPCASTEMSSTYAPTPTARTSDVSS